MLKLIFELGKALGDLFAFFSLLSGGLGGRSVDIVNGLRLKYYSQWGPNAAVYLFFLLSYQDGRPSVTRRCEGE